MVSIEVSGDDEGARKFLKEKGITFPSLKGVDADPGKLFGVESTPTNLVIDPSGRILFRKIGFSVQDGSARLESYVQATLARKPAPKAEAE